jgi:hypothetical protein
LEKIIPSYHRLSVFLGNCCVVVNQAEFLHSIKTLNRNQPAQLPDLGELVPGIFGGEHNGGVVGDDAIFGLAVPIRLGPLMGFVLMLSTAH